jgi:hypothetical protein
MGTETKEACPDCGAANAVGALLCWSCARPLPTPDPTSAGSLPPGIDLFRQLNVRPEGVTASESVARRRRVAWIATPIATVVLVVAVVAGTWWASGRVSVRFPDKIGSQIRLVSPKDESGAAAFSQSHQQDFPQATIRTAIYGPLAFHRTLVLTAFEGTGASTLQGFQDTMVPGMGDGDYSSQGGTEERCYVIPLGWVTHVCYWRHGDVFGITMVKAVTDDDAIALSRTAVDSVLTSWREEFFSD